MKSIAALALLPLAFANPLPAPGTAPPAFKINSIANGGSGCPQGSIDVSFTDSTILPIYFNGNFTAAVGPGVSVDQQRKNCQLSISLSYSPGYTYSLYSADYYGYADLQPGVKGVIRSKYYFSGSTDETSSTSTFNGPVSGFFNKHDEVDVSIWSPCSGSSIFNVNTEAYLIADRNGGNGVIAAFKDNQRFSNSLHISWKKC